MLREPTRVIVPLEVIVAPTVPDVDETVPKQVNLVAKHDGVVVE
jgi:hypothetical protein